MRTRALASPLCFWCLFAAVLGGCSRAPETVDALRTTLVAAREAGDYGRAQRLAERLLAARQREGAPCAIADAQADVDALRQLAALPRAARDSMGAMDRACAAAETAGDMPAASAALEQRFRLLESVFGGEHVEVAEAAAAIGVAAIDADDLPGAVEWLQVGLAADQRAGRSGTVIEARHQMLLAEALDTAGETDVADSLMQVAVQAVESTCGSTSDHFAEALFRMAEGRMIRGEYALATPLYRRALDIARAHDPPTLLLREVLNAYGDLLFQLGDFATSAEVFRQQIALDEARSGATGAEHAATLANHAAALDESGQPMLAETQYLRAIRLFREDEQADPERLAAALNGLAMLYTDRGDPQRAEPLYAESLALYRQASGEHSPAYASVTLNQARNLREARRFAESESLYAQSLVALQQARGDFDADLGRLLYSYGSLLTTMEQHERAEPLFARSASIYELCRSRIATGIERATFQETPYFKLANARLHLGREPDAWEAVERGQGRAISDMMQRSKVRDLSEGEQALEDSLWSAVAPADPTAGDGATEAAAGPADKTVAAAHRALVEFERRLALRSPVIEGGAYPLTRVQAQLAANAAIVGWLDVEEAPGRFATWRYSIRRNGPVHWERLAASDSSANPMAAAAAFRRHLVSPEALEEGSQAAALVARIPVGDPVLRGVRRLVVIPSGAIQGIPVEALQTADGTYLGEHFEVEYAPSATVYAWLRERRARTGNRPFEVLAVGDPDFGSLAKRTSNDKRQVRRLQLGAASLDSLTSLPGSRAEVESIAAIFPRTTKLLGSDASERQLDGMGTSGGLERYRILHLATHAFADNRRPERSFLVLARAGLPDAAAAARRGEQVEDGLVTAAQVARDWRLDADLVTLSACETGAGRQVSGEGYVGLAQAFLQAGARSVLVSLWPVDDEATALLMSRFYALLAPGGHGELASGAGALREAKAWLRQYRAGDRTPYAHPFYWSGFVLIGDGRARAL